MPGGSKIRINFPNGPSHNSLVDKDLAYQHILEAIYRREDGKSLADILKELDV